MRKPTLAIALLAVILLGAGAWHFAQRDPFELPGQTWERDFLLAGDTIRLLDSGKYVSYHWCDICKIEYKFGSWSKTGDIVTLQPDSQDRPRRQLRAQLIGSCEYLIQLDLEVKNPLSLALQPEKQDCRDGR